MELGEIGVPFLGMSDVAAAGPSTRIPKWTFGDRLRKAREDADIDQAEMGRQFGVSSGTISNWERSGTIPRKFGHIGVAEKWAEITNVSAAWLLGSQSTTGYKTDSPTLDLIEGANDPYQLTLRFAAPLAVV